MRGIYMQNLIAPPEAIDVNGHVNNLEYLRWMQEIAIAHSAAQGWDMARYQAMGSGWVIRSHTIDYLRPAFVNDEIIIATWIAGFAEQTSPRKYLFVRSANRKILARAETLWVYVDAQVGRPTPIPDAFKAAFDVVGDEREVVQFLEQTR